MVLESKRVWLVFAVLSILTGVGTAATYHLSGDNSWQNAADTPEGEYLLEVSKIKQQLLTGTKSDVVKALEQLKTDFPDMAGAEIQAYLDAEKLYAKAKWYKAATAYKEFIDAWPVSVRIGDRMGVEISHGAIELAQHRDVAKFFLCSTQARNDIGNFFAQRRRTGRLTMSSREHRHGSVPPGK